MTTLSIFAAPNVAQRENNAMAKDGTVMTVMDRPREMTAWQQAVSQINFF